MSRKLALFLAVSAETVMTHLREGGPRNVIVCDLFRVCWISLKKLRDALCLVDAKRAW
jgi:hypothetical protein